MDLRDLHDYNYLIYVANIKSLQRNSNTMVEEWKRAAETESMRHYMLYTVNAAHL